MSFHLESRADYVYLLAGSWLDCRPGSRPVSRRGRLWKQFPQMGCDLGRCREQGTISCPNSWLRGTVNTSPVQVAPVQVETTEQRNQLPALDLEAARFTAGQRRDGAELQTFWIRHKAHPHRAA